MKAVKVTYKDNEGVEHTDSAMGTDAYRHLECLENDGYEIISIEWTEVRQ